MLQEDHLQMSAKGGVAVARERNRITSLGPNRRTVHIPVYRDITCIMNARILNLPLYRTEGGGTEFLTPYADPYNELWLYNELTRILNGGGGG